MKTGYITETESIYFKHEISKNLPINVYSTHTHSVYELLYFLNGDATYVIEDRKYKLKKGDLLLIRPFRYHFIQIDSPTDYERYDILFDPKRHRVDGVDRIDEKTEVIHLHGNAIAEGIFKRMDLYRERFDDEGFSLLLSHLISELLCCISVLPSEDEETGKSLSPLVSGALQYINQSLCTIKSVQEIAERLFVSESYLFRRFKKEIHQTPKQYIMNKRLLLARQRIADGETPTAVCQALGFGDYTSFYRSFRAFFGQTPSAAADNGKQEEAI